MSTDDVLFKKSSVITGTTPYSDNSNKDLEVKLLVNNEEPNDEEMALSKTEKKLCCFIGGSKKARVMKCSLLTFSVIAAIALVSIFAIIPSYTKHVVGESEITIVEANIINPTDTSFTSIVTQKFDQSSPVHTTINFEYIDISWDEAGGGKMVQLEDLPEITVSKDPTEMSGTANVQNITALTNFNHFAINNEETQWHIHGHAEVTVAGFIKTGVTIDKLATMHGFNNFPIPPIIKTVDTIDGTVDLLHNHIVATITSESNIGLHFGEDLHFGLFSEDIKIGSGMIAEAAFEIGEFTVDIDVFMEARDDTENAQLMKLLGNFSGQVDSPIVLQDFYLNEPVSWLTESLAGLRMDTKVPGVEQQILTSIKLYNPRTLLQAIYVELYLYNPTDAVLTITQIHSDVYCNEGAADGEYTQISTLTADGLSEVIQPKEYITTEKLKSAKKISIAGVAIFEALVAKGEGTFNIKSQIIFKIGEFEASVDFWQYDIPVAILVA